MTVTDIQAQEEERRRYLVDTFGEDVLVGLATDPPAASSRSAEKHAKNYYGRRREAHLERVQDTVTAAAGLRADQDAYERAMADPERASVQDQVAADRHIRRHGLVPRLSTAQRLAGRRG